MSSRLDRLFVLLESGSSPPTRRAAAKQLGEVQRLHPQELHSLLRRIRTLLHSPTWETRVAAGQAVAAVVASLPPWDPLPVEDATPTPARVDILDRFDIRSLLKSGAQLTGSEGTQYDLEEGNLGSRVISTGISASQAFGLELSEILTEEDLEPETETAQTSSQSVSEMVEVEISQAGGQSSRERNLARRRAKLRPLEMPKPEIPETEEPKRKRVKLPETPGTGPGSGDDDSSTLPECVPDATGSWVNGSEWPLQWFCDELLTDLFSPRWERRHGAATALREVLICHGAGAGRSVPATKAQMEADHEAWLQDAALRVISVLCLDRFGDYLSDTVVAPVRETCAQVLGALFKLLAPDSVRGVLRIIEQMCQQTQWETRHGALLALKYCLSVRKELVGEVLSTVLPLAVARLYDDEDDVSGVAAAALVPLADDIARDMADQIPDLVRKLWSLLQVADQDDLVAASHAFMGLLAALLNCPAARDHLQDEKLDDVLPRLWPFLGHNYSTSVRKSTLHTLHTLTTGPLVCSSKTLHITLRHIYQRALLEPSPDVLKLVERAWENLVCGSERDRVMEAVCPCFGTWLCLAMQSAKVPFDHTYLLTNEAMEGQILYLGGGESSAHCMLVRATAARMLGLVAKRLLDGDLDGPDSPLPPFVNVMLTHLASRSALQRMLCGLVLTELHRLRDSPLPCPRLNDRVLACAAESVPFDEVLGPLSRLLADCRDLTSQLPLPRPPPPATLEAAVAMATQPVPPPLEERRATLQAAAEAVQLEQTAYSVSVQAALAGSIVHLKNLGERLSPIVRPLMDSVRRESDELLQRQTAENLALLVSLCVSRTPCPNSKIISNLRAFISEDFPPCKTGEILTSVKQQRDAERILLKRQSSQTSRGPGRPPCVVQVPSSPLPDLKKEKADLVQRRGAALALQAMARQTGESLPDVLPQLWANVLPSTDTLPTPDLITNLQVLEVVAPALTPSLLPQVLDRMSTICTALCSEQPALRHTASRAFASLALLAPERVMHAIVTQVLPLLASPALSKRAGAAEALACVIASLELAVVPYIVLLLVPLLGRMADPDSGVRSICTQTFASLVQIMPLESSQTDTGLLAAERAQERVFLQQLLNPSAIPDFVIPVPVKAELRAYQQAGVNWLAFLNKYKLHGILCDDMGLGKTLQTICMLAADHFTKSDCPSLVICPPTLTGHWVAEIEKFVSLEYLQPLLYAGAPTDRERLREGIGVLTVVVASYDIVRKDIDFFRTVPWNYCVLDEGHVIKNGKTKASKAIKSLTASHRLILSGTPIQNNVLELWSLFDFLMPGFLGSERQFNTKFGRPILASRDAKVSSKEQEAGVMAMEALHRQVLPFLLRRVKEDVLKDLPPRITQDYVCELSPLQELLYEDFSKTQAHQHLEDSLSHSNSHIFQALRYLQNVCNHPKLVLTSQHPQYDRIQRILQQQNSTLDDIRHACKLPALKQLLLDCGIGLGNDAPITQHRALIFCQLKAMLDVVQRLLTQHLPSVSFLRLDGMVPPLQRHRVVNKFNTDPTIDVLLLTTHVGGLGLNLTGADTVIFVEHDWNPMKDLQAMDRAHRIGQKKVVNVYRLITKGTLEEKIMGLQKFKLLTANTVISQQNSSLETMATHGLLDLFTLQTDSQKPKENATGRSLLDSLPDLWEQQHQYDEEYDLSSFVTQLSR